MTWLFSKVLMQDYENSRCSQGQEAESSEVTCSDGEPYAQLNVMPTPHKFWRNDKTMDASDLSRFGLTLRLLTDDNGAALLTWYLEAFHVKKSQSSVVYMANNLASLASEADCGQNKSASFVKYDHDSHGWKTAQCSLLGDSESFWQTWPSWGFMRHGECWELPISAEITTGKESGYWATPTATDGKGAPRLETILRRSEESSRGVRLPEQIAKCLGIDLTTKLNPEWSEQLMGWPIGWTDLKPLEMARFQQWQQQHGGFLADETK